LGNKKKEKWNPVVGRNENDKKKRRHHAVRGKSVGFIRKKTRSMIKLESQRQEVKKGKKRNEEGKVLIAE